jgi:hypothetical protein
MNEYVRIRVLEKALRDIVHLIKNDYREGDKEYQAVIIAESALVFDVEEEMFSYRREGHDD